MDEEFRGEPTTAMLMDTTCPWCGDVSIDKPRIEPSWICGSFVYGRRPRQGRMCKKVCDLQTIIDKKGAANDR